MIITMPSARSLWSLQLSRQHLVAVFCCLSEGTRRANVHTRTEGSRLGSLLPQLSIGRPLISVCGPLGSSLSYCMVPIFVLAIGLCICNSICSLHFSKW